MSPPQFAPFDAPKLKVEWGRRRIKDLETLLTAYAQRVSFTIGPDPYSVPCDEFDFYRMLPSEQLPNNVSLLIGEIVHPLRSALDVMVCDIARTQGKEGQFNFPFAKDEESFDKVMLKHPVRKLGPLAVHLIKECRPYKVGGNQFLRGLHDLDVVDKHRLIIPMIGAACFQSPIISDGDFRIEFNMRVIFYEGQSWQVRKGLPFEVRFEEAQLAEPVFANPLPFGGEPVVKTVYELADQVEEIINQFEPHFWDRERRRALTPSDQGYDM